MLMDIFGCKLVFDTILFAIADPMSVLALFSCNKQLYYWSLKETGFVDAENGSAYDYASLLLEHFFPYLPDELLRLRGAHAMSLLFYLTKPVRDRFPIDRRLPLSAAVKLALFGTKNACCFVANNGENNRQWSINSLDGSFTLFSGTITCNSNSLQLQIFTETSNWKVSDTVGLCYDLLSNNGFTWTFEYDSHDVLGDCFVALNYFPTSLMLIVETIYSKTKSVMYHSTLIDFQSNNNVPTF
jgi:hypothetical protein